MTYRSIDDSLGGIYANLIDILFAIVLAEGFVFFSSSNGLLSWLATDNTVSIIDTLTVYIIVIGSWIRYHAVIQKYPRESNVRFIIDIILMIGYYFAFVEVGNAFITSIAFSTIFALYAIWSVLRTREYPESRNDRWTLGYRKNIIFTVLAIGIAIVQYFHLWISVETFVPLLMFALVLSYTWLPFSQKKKQNTLDSYV